MKKVLLISFMLLCMMLFTVPVFAMKNEPDNFRGIPWGAEPPKNNLFGKNKWGLKQLSTSNLYWRDEEVSIGGAKITAPINYTFHDDFGFACAVVLFRGQGNYDLIYKACIENWGKPDQERREENKEFAYDQAEAFWIGQKVTVRISYYFKPNEMGELRLYLNTYAEAKRREVEEIIREGQKESGL